MYGIVSTVPYRIVTRILAGRWGQSIAVRTYPVHSLRTVFFVRIHNIYNMLSQQQRLYLCVHTNPILWNVLLTHEPCHPTCQLVRTEKCEECSYLVLTQLAVFWKFLVASCLVSPLDFRKIDFGSSTYNTRPSPNVRRQCRYHTVP